jgi:hypothetical protein
MDLTLRTVSYGVDNLTWLGSREGTDTARSVTLKSTAVPRNADNMVPSGTPLKASSSGGTYELWTTGATLAGFLLTPQKVVDTAVNVVGPMIDRGRIVGANLPTAVDTAGRTSAPRFIFV